MGAEGAAHLVRPDAESVSKFAMNEEARVISRGYVDPGYLRGAAELLAPVKEQSYAWMAFQPGHQVLDLGCGPGSDTVALALRVGAAGRVIGVDSDRGMLAEARLRATEAGVGAWTLHQLANAGALPFKSDCFHASRSERLFQHLAEPEGVLREMLRVTRRGGWVVVLDTDWGTLSLHSNEIDLERRLARVHCERLLHNGYAGRQLYHLFKRQRLAEIRIEVYPVYLVGLAQIRALTVLDEVEQAAANDGLISGPELERWHASLAEIDVEEGLFCTATLVMVGGRKP